MTIDSAQSLFWISLGALMVPMLSRKIHLPSSVGEIIYGMLIGPHLAGLMLPDDFIDFMARLGFAILMFNAGMEIDFAPLRKRGSRLLRVAWQWAIMTAAAVIVGFILLDIHPWAVLAVCSVSIGLASVALKERELLGKPIGQAMLAAGLIGESFSILLLTVFDINFRVGFNMEFLWSVAQFMGLFLLAYLLMRVFRFIIWWAPRKIAAFLESGDPLELGMRLAMAMLFIFLAAATFLGVEAILGAFIAGALFGFIFQEREVIADKFSAMGQGFFVPFFFIVVGSHFDPVESLRMFSPAMFLKLIGLAVAVKMLPAVIFGRAGLDWREIAATGVLLAAPLTLTVAVAEVGASAGAINKELLGMLILVAITNGLACPFIAKLILPQENGARPEKGRGR